MTFYKHWLIIKSLIKKRWNDYDIFIFFLNKKLAEDILKFIIFSCLLDKNRWHKFIKRWHKFIKRWHDFVFFGFGLNLAR